MQQTYTMLGRGVYEGTILPFYFDLISASQDTFMQSIQF